MSIFNISFEDYYLKMTLNILFLIFIVRVTQNLFTVLQTFFLRDSIILNDNVKIQ